MAQRSDLISRVRLEMGDLVETFRSALSGTGEQTSFDLNGRNIQPGSVSVHRIETNNTRTQIPSTNYTIDYTHGRITFTAAPGRDEQIVVEAASWGVFSDEELGHYVEDALDQHLQERTETRRYRDGRGFIRYDREEMTIENLPRNEHILVTILAAIEALWALSTDASTDIDVATAEGTSIPRGQRFRQIVEQVENLHEKYDRLSLAMGVGLYSPETVPVRRISRMNNRLVPIFVPREYDESGPPVRVVPPIPRRHADPDGPASPWYPHGHNV